MKENVANTDGSRLGATMRSAAAIAALSTTPVAVTMQPGMVQGMADFLGFSQAQAGYVASAEMFGVMAGTIVFAIASDRVNWRWTLAGGLLLAVALNLASVGQRGYEAMLALRVATGLGCGVATAVGWSLLGEMRDPSRGFGWAMAGIILFAAVGFAIMPALFKIGGYGAFLIFVAAALGLCLPLALFVKRTANMQAADAGTSARRRGRSFAGVLALISFLAFSTAYPMAWTYMSLVGRDAGVDAAGVSQVFSTTQFFGVAGGLMMAAIGGRFGYALPASLVLGIGAASITGLQFLSGMPSFFLANAVFQFAWNGGIPIVLGVIAARGASGGLLRYAIPLQFVGMAAAPALAAVLLGGEAYDRVVWSSVGLALASFAALAPLIVAGGARKAEG